MKKAHIEVSELHFTKLPLFGNREMAELSIGRNKYKVYKLPDGSHYDILYCPAEDDEFHPLHQGHSHEQLTGFLKSFFTQQLSLFTA
jgi:hypothetical protein